MAKAYTVVAYRKITDPAAFAAYAELAGPAIQQAGGRFVARGPAARTFEAGIAERLVIVEFDSVEKAVAAYESDAYRKALSALGETTERDVRIVAGV